MEIFGIPIFFIILIIIVALAENAQKKQKEKEEITKKQQKEIEEIGRKWDAINTGMNKEEVLMRLGKPNRVVEMGAEEAWGYGPSKSDGEILFVAGRVVGYQKPSCTVDVFDEHPFDFEIIVPQDNAALQDSVTLTVKASDASGIVEVYFHIREDDGKDEGGKPTGYDELVATFNETTGQWEYPFDTTELSDGHYFIVAIAFDSSGNDDWRVVTIRKKR